MLTVGFFYLFAVLAVGSAAMVIIARNPVHAVLFLILTFFNAAGLFILLGAEFLAMLLIIVYVGAVAVLFLFVTMMLDVDFAELKAGFIKNAPAGMLVGGIVLAELVALFIGRTLNLGVGQKLAAVAPAGVHNTKALGLLLYTKYAYFFQASALILLVAMIGAIVLTHRRREDVKRQNISAQNARTPATAMEVIKVPSGGYTIPAAKGTPVAAEKAKAEAAE
ncbi:MAG: NADH-quinone oxidoreductase subunit J [Hyphomicrobiaceae bacterium]